MNILILGGNGFLGSAVTSALRTNGHNVFVVGIGVNKNDVRNFDILLSDVEHIKMLLQEKNITIVMHLVSSLLPSSNIENFSRDLDSIFSPTIELLNYCADNKIKFVYFSSGGAVYGNQKEIFSEKTKREPVSLYGLSKLNFENAISFFYNTKGLEYLIIRPSNPYGEGQNIYGKQGIIAVIIGKILKNETIQIWGDGSAVKDYIYIDDFVFYVTRLIENSNSWYQIYNVGSGIGTSVNNVLATFIQNGIHLPEVEYIASKNTDVKQMVLDCTKIQNICPHKCINLAEGIKRFWEYANK